MKALGISVPGIITTISLAVVVGFGIIVTIEQMGERDLMAIFTGAVTILIADFTVAAILSPLLQGARKEDTKDKENTDGS